MLAARIASGVALLSVITAARSRAQEMAVPVPVQFSLFYRILTYDRELATRTANGLVICVPYQGQFRASMLAKNEVIRQEPPADVGYAVRFVPLDLDVVDLRVAVLASGCEALYVTPLRGLDVATIVEVGHGRGVLTLTGVPGYVRRGCAVGIGVNDNRPEILINVAGATAEGAVFSAQLLRVSRVL